ncbi:Ger(x)C family spore germination protein [Paenibacillus vietnamensis]|uniref:Ger(x)C family spore germination protein n=1 Tax=Paenibacillus vietnamensis TaxID=2590547 RepID=UPI001CD173CA|nr:Ger(x)C family spore germination protein [Paenibacillus vietnamensis]
MRKKVLLILFLIPVLTGCWDRREIEERTSAVAIGIDLAENNPEMLEISVQIPIPIRIAGSSGSGSSGSGKGSVTVESATGRTVKEATQNLQKKLNQKLFFGHTRIITISEAAARRGINKLLDPFRRDPEIRRLLWPLIIKGRAIDSLRVSPHLEQIPTVFIMTMIENGAKKGTVTQMNLGSLFISLTSPAKQPYLNYFQVKGNELKWSGLAVFKKDRMIGLLNDKDAWALLRISENKNGSDITYVHEEDPSQLVTITTQFIGRDEKITFNGQRVSVKIYIEMESNLIEKTFGADLFQTKQIDAMEKEAEAHLAKITNRVVQKLQKDLNSDIIGIGDRLRAYHPSIWKKVDWERAFPQADIEVIFDVKIRNTGMEMS